MEFRLGLRLDRLRFYGLCSAVAVLRSAKGANTAQSRRSRDFGVKALACSHDADRVRARTGIVQQGDALEPRWWREIDGGKEVGELIRRAYWFLVSVLPLEGTGGAELDLSKVVRLIVFS